MIESDDKITFNPNFETQNSIINEKYIDYSNESIKDFVNNELKAIDNSDTTENGKEITFCNIDSTEYSDASVILSLLMFSFRGLEAQRLLETIHRLRRIN